ncbi:MAG: hypothetical protein NT003_02620 [Candidatus Magasanikbacteria bacterium]|nr:hypothetical protein [Candidatus Magasanikbacteria bacterium]
MTSDDFSSGVTESEIFEELKIRNELEPIESRDQYSEILDEIIAEKVDFGELNPDDDTVSLKENLMRRFDDLIEPVEL